MKGGLQQLKKIKNINIMYKNIVLTGSEGFLGKHLRKELQKNNFNVICIDKFNLKRLHYFNCDLSKTKEIFRTIKNIKKNYKDIDVLINLAAVQIFTDFEKRRADEIDLMLNVNIRANLILTQFIFNNYFKKQNRGNIINLASIFGIISPNFKNYRPGDRKSSETYGATKAALIQLTRYFANYMSEYNVRVNSISPGGIYNSKVQSNSFVKRYEKNVPLRFLGTDEDVIHQVMFLISDKSKYTTGQNIVIDGGYTII